LRFFYGGDIAANELFAPLTSLGDQFRSFEHRDVLLHRGETHWIKQSERRNRMLPLKGPFDDVASRGVTQRVEELIRLLGRKIIYNHMVVDYLFVRKMSSSLRTST